MPFIGRQPTIGNFQVCDAISVVNGQAAYTMQVGGVNVSPESANHMIVSLNGVIQKPTDAYTVSNSVITFASNLVTGDVIDFIQILGNVLDLGVPSDNTVSLAKLTATGTKDATTFLRGDNTFAEAGGGITMADQWRLTANKTGNSDITANLERVDTTGQGILGTGMTESSGIFSFPETGIYLVSFDAWGNAPDEVGGDTQILLMKVTTNNSTYNIVADSTVGDGDNRQVHVSNSSLVDVTDISNVKVKFTADSMASGTFWTGATDYNTTSFTFIRLGDT